MLQGFALSLALAVGEAVIMAVLQRFIPILRGALPPAADAPAPGSRLAIIQRNRFFFGAFVMYLITALAIGGVFCILPLVRGTAAEINQEGSSKSMSADATPLRDAKFFGPYLPDIDVPATLLSGVTLQVAMLSTVVCMIITGVIFWPIWRVYRALGHDSFDHMERLHATAAAFSIFVAAWLIFYLFAPVGLLGATIILAIIVGGSVALSKLFGARQK